MGSILYSKAQKLYEENNSVYHALVLEQDFQQSPALPDAVACKFSATEKLGECLDLVTVFNITLHCSLTFCQASGLNWPNPTQLWVLNLEKLQ